MTDKHHISKIDSETLKAVGLNIRKYRKLKGLTQNELADLSMISRSQGQAYEYGKINQSVISLRKIANTLGISMAHLFEGL